jgi:hypothetical protein
LESTRLRRKSGLRTPQARVAERDRYRVREERHKPLSLIDRKGRGKPVVDDEHYALVTLTARMRVDERHLPAVHDNIVR